MAARSRFLCLFLAILLAEPLPLLAEAAPTDAQKKAALAEFVEKTGQNGEGLADRRGRVTAAFCKDLDAYLAAAGKDAGAVTGLARTLAKSIYGSATFDYNVKLVALAARMRDPKQSWALVPVAMELAQEWHGRRWERRLVIGGIVVAAVGVTVVSAGFSTFLLACFGTTGALSAVPTVVAVGALGVTADAALALAAWWLYRQNPVAVCFPEVSQAVAKAIARGQAVEVEDLLPKQEAATGAEGFDDLLHR